MTAGSSTPRQAPGAPVLVLEAGPAQEAAALAAAGRGSSGVWVVLHRGILSA